MTVFPYHADHAGHGEKGAVRREDFPWFPLILGVQIPSFFSRCPPRFTVLKKGPWRSLVRSPRYIVAAASAGGRAATIDVSQRPYVVQKSKITHELLIARSAQPGGPKTIAQRFIAGGLSKQPTTACRQLLFNRRFCRFARIFREGPRELGSKILKRQRQLTVGHIRKLAEYFRVSPAAFV